MSSPSKNSNVLVYGAGAVGCLLGGLLAHGGCQVTLRGRQGRGTEIRDHGLQVNLHGNQFSTRPGYVETIKELESPPDLIVLATRAFDVESALPDLRRVTGDRSVLLTVQNGVGTEELIAGALTGVPHVAGSLTLSAGFEAPGQVESTSRSGGIALSPVSAGADVQAIASLFAASGVPVGIKGDYRSMKWSKLLLNMMANAVPAILGWTPGKVYRHPGMFQIERAAVREALSVMRADGSRAISLPGFPVPALTWLFRLPDSLSRRLLLPRVEGGRGDKMPSLLLDLDSGRKRTEARWLYGAVASAGKRLGVATPVNQRLLAIMEAIAENPGLRESFRDRPDLLARNVLLGAEAGEHPFVSR